jgi:hypothetical protein
MRKLLMAFVLAGVLTAASIGPVLAEAIGGCC